MVQVTHAVIVIGAGSTGENVAGARLRADGYRGWATIALVAAVPLERLWHAVPSYPTLSEVWLRLLETCGL
jgi:hypothetical protein